MKKFQFINYLLVTIFILIVTLNITSCVKPNLTTECRPTSGGAVSPANSDYDKGLMVQITASPAAGYRFDHWEGSASGKGSTVQITMDGNKKVIAFFTKTYILNVSASPTNGGTISPTRGTFDEGQNVTIVAQPATNYQFSGWVGDLSSNSNSSTVIMNADKNIVASFTKGTHSLQVNIGTPNSGTVQPSNGNFDAGSSVTITAIPAQGYRFNRWEGSTSSTSKVLNIGMDNNKTLTAFFTRVYNLNLSVNPNGSGSIASNPASTSLDDGSTVTLSATANFPYVFSNWTGTDNDTANPTTIKMNSDKSPILNFVELKPGTRQVKSGTIYNYGTPVPVIPLQAGQWVELGVSLTPNSPVSILDPDFSVIQDLGVITNTSYRFQAKKTGDYSVKIIPNAVFSTGFTLTYTIYSR